MAGTLARSSKDGQGWKNEGGRWSARTWRWALAIGLVTVPVSSLLGLLRPEMELERAIEWVWRANLWGDIVFTLGTLGLFLAVLRAAGWLRAAARAPLFGLLLGLVPLALMGTWVVYVASWTFTSTAVDNPGFLRLALTWDDNVGETWEWGWPGILGMGVLVPLAAGLTMRFVDGPLALPPRVTADAHARS